MKKEHQSRRVGQLAKSTNLSCKEIAKHICGELDEHIDSPKCRKIKKHLKACPNCTAYLDSLKKTVHLYREYSYPTVTVRCRKNLFAMLKLGK
jgi:predicted anti-sigma-YlaC factor YlaD